MKTITMCFELIFSTITWRTMSMDKFFLRKYCRLLPERVFLWQFLITHISFASLKFRACYIMAQWCQFTVKNITFVYLYFFGIVLFFFIKKSMLCHFHFLFFYEISNFRNNILSNQRVGIGDKKLSVEL